MYAIRGFAVHATPEEVATTTRLLGRAPTDYADYVRDTAARWSVPGRGSLGAGSAAGV